MFRAGTSEDGKIYTDGPFVGLSSACVMPTTPIPAIWRIDVEPDEIQDRPGEKSWDGFSAMADLVDGLRDRLAERSGYAPRPSWFLRLDPDIERRFGRLDFVARRHAGVLDKLVGRSDPLGIHVHAYRWDAARQVAFSDYADDAWTSHCLAVAAESFAQCFGEPPRLASQGGYFMSSRLLQAAVSLGIQVDVSVEPGLRARDNDKSFGAYATAPSPDYRDCPQRPYYPSADSFTVPAASVADASPLLLVPLTSYDYRFALSSWPRKTIKHLLGMPRQSLPLNPWKPWPSPKTYWDLVERAVDGQTAGYFAFALRTDAPGSHTHQRVKALLEYLPEHPIAARLNFVDPLGPEIRALAIPTASSPVEMNAAQRIRTKSHG
jgi:hypothetical protein